MNRWEKELKEVSEKYESYRSFMPPEAMITTDTFIKGYRRAKHVDLYNQMILQLEYYYHFVLPLEQKEALDLVRSASLLAL